MKMHKQMGGASQCMAVKNCCSLGSVWLHLAFITATSPKRV